MMLQQLLLYTFIVLLPKKSISYDNKMQSSPFGRTKYGNKLLSDCAEILQGS